MIASPALRAASELHERVPLAQVMGASEVEGEREYEATSQQRGTRGGKGDAIQVLISDDAPEDDLDSRNKILIKGDVQ